MFTRDQNNIKRTILIKRYQNRKLYDTANSRYVTLDEIGDLVRGGEDVKVVDNKTHEDMTSVTLSQIIFEEQKNKKNTLPLLALNRIIRGGSDVLVDWVSRTTENVQSKITQARDNAENIIVKVRDEIGDVENKIKHGLDNITHKIGLQNDVKRLKERIEALELRLKNHDKK